MSGQRLALEMHVVATMPCQGTVLNQGGHDGHAGACFFGDLGAPGCGASHHGTYIASINANIRPKHYYAIYTVSFFENML